MRIFLAVLVALAFTAAVSIGGATTAVKRSVVNPAFYSGMVSKINLPELLGSVVEKVSGKDSQIAQVTRLAFTHIETEIRKQTTALISKLFLYLRGKESTFTLAYDMSSLQKDTSFVNVVVNHFVKSEKMKSVSDFLIKPVAQQLVAKLPSEINLQKLAGIDDKRISSIREKTMIALPKFDTYHNYTLGLIAILLVILVLLLASARKSAFFVGSSLIIAGIILCIPLLYADRLFSTDGRPFAQFLHNLNIIKVLKAELISVYIVSPIVCLATGALAVTAGFFLKKEQKV